MKILVLVAGTNDPSNADTLADAFIEGIRTIEDKEKSATVTVEKLYLRDLPLEQFDLSHYEATKDQGANYATIKNAIEAADALVIASPIWNFSIPGHLKNTIDRIGAFCLDPDSKSMGQLGGMPAFLILTGGMPHAGWVGLQRKTVSHLPVSLRYFGCVITGRHYEERCTPGRGKFAVVVDKRPDSLAAMRRKGGHFAAVALHFANTGKLPAWEAFMYWLFQTGQTIKKKLGL